MIQIDRETFQMMLHQIMERFDKIEDRLNRMNRQTSALDGDKLLDNQDMCELLGITKRTLARYRQKKLVAYYMIDGRTYYKSSDFGILDTARWMGFVMVKGLLPTPVEQG